MKRKTMITLALLSALGASSAAWAVDYPLPPANSRLIGQNQYWTVQEGDRNLQAIARHSSTAGDADPRSQRYHRAGAAEAWYSGPDPLPDAAPRRTARGDVVT